MARAIVVTVLLSLLISGTAFAGENYYVAMFTAGETRDGMNVNIADPYTPYEVWVWILPGDDGLKGFDFKIVIGDDICSTNTDNPDISVTLNSPTSSWGWVGSFGSGLCQYDWVWLTKLDMLAVSTDPHHIEIVDNPKSHAVEASTCLEGYPIVDMIVYNSFGINAPGEVEARESSWGAIKSAYR